jgi:hypothetical protein
VVDHSAEVLQLLQVHDRYNQTDRIVVNYIAIWR